MTPGMPMHHTGGTLTPVLGTVLAGLAAAGSIVVALDRCRPRPVTFAHLAMGLAMLAMLVPPTPWTTAASVVVLGTAWCALVRARVQPEPTACRFDLAAMTVLLVVAGAGLPTAVRLTASTAVAAGWVLRSFCVRRRGGDFAGRDAAPRVEMATVVLAAAAMAVMTG